MLVLDKDMFSTLVNIDIEMKRRLDPNVLKTLIGGYELGLTDQHYDTDKEGSVLCADNSLAFIDLNGTADLIDSRILKQMGEYFTKLGDFVRHIEEVTDQLPDEFYYYDKIGLLDMSNTDVYKKFMCIFE